MACSGPFSNWPGELTGLVNSSTARKYDFFASTGIGLCNIGAFNGVVGGLLTAIETGGSSM